MKNFLLPQDLLEHLARYISSKPYAEAYGFMEALKQLKEAPDAKEHNPQSSGQPVAVPDPV